MSEERLNELRQELDEKEEQYENLGLEIECLKTDIRRMEA